MNIFILNSGRCGSSSFIKVCQHISNYSAAHESRSHLTGSARIIYPDNHIEADNRLSWLLGRLDQQYGDAAFYVHLIRDSSATASSFEKRSQFGIMRAYREGILLNAAKKITDREIALDYLDTVDANIQCFLKDKSRKLTMRLENIQDDFREFWQQIGAQGNLTEALNGWQIHHNAS